MKGLVCKVCGYVALDGNKSVCPVCHQENQFQEEQDAYKTPDFKATSGESEKKHIPAFTVVNECGLIPHNGCAVDVHVKIGEILHPTLPQHHITEITFYLNNKFIANVMLTSDINPAAVIHLKSGTKGKVQVIENCNVHGKWFNEVEIK
jgi:superoxide reductase